MLSESVALCVYPKENSRLTDGQATLEIERVAVMKRRCISKEGVVLDGW
jgi:hypothetical protein